MTILAIDPGSEQSAWVLFDGVRVRDHAIWPNADVLDLARDGALGDTPVVIEEIASYGMAVGREVFQTVRWSGRFEQAVLERLWRTGCGSVRYLLRREVKLHLCQSARAKDANVRQALLDRFGGEKVAKGCKALPGPLYGLRKDEWAALAIACTWWDLHPAVDAVGLSVELARRSTRA